MKPLTFNSLCYTISKKNGILMNNIGVNYVYPFLYKNIIDIGYWNRHLNFKGKKSHKQACANTIDAEILKKIVKVGGTTDSNALFDKCEYLNDIQELVNKSKYNIFKINKNMNSDTYKEYLLKVLYLEIFEYLFIENISNIKVEKTIKLGEFLKEKSNTNEQYIEKQKILF